MTPKPNKPVTDSPRTETGSPAKPSPFGTTQSEPVHGGIKIDEHKIAYSAPATKGGKSLLECEKNPVSWRSLARNNAARWLIAQSLTDGVRRNKMLDDLTSILDGEPCTYTGYLDYMVNVRREWQAYDELRPVTKLSSAMQQGVYTEVLISRNKLTLTGERTVAISVMFGTDSMVDGPNWIALQSYGFAYHSDHFWFNGQPLIQGSTNDIEPLTLRFNRFQSIDKHWCVKIEDKTMQNHQDELTLPGADTPVKLPIVERFEDIPGPRPKYKQHTAVPGEMIHAVPNHIKRELQLDRNAGYEINKIFKKPLTQELIIELTPAKTWDMVEAYVAANRPTPKPEERPFESSSPIDEKAANRAQVDTGQDLPVEIDSEAPQEIIEKSPAAKPTTLVGPLASATTLTGIRLDEIAMRMDAIHPKGSYRPFKMSSGIGTDIEQDRVRDRFDEVFGLHGIGWKLEPHPVLGSITETETEKIDKYKKPFFEYSVTLLAYVFKYQIILNGEMMWIELSPMSDNHTGDRDKGFVHRGAFTSLLKQVLRSMGGFNHLYRNEDLQKWAREEYASTHPSND